MLAGIFRLPFYFSVVEKIKYMKKNNLKILLLLPLIFVLVISIFNNSHLGVGLAAMFILTIFYSLIGMIIIWRDKIKTVPAKIGLTLGGLQV